MEQTVVTTIKSSEPDWFRIGRDAARVMARLSGMRELDFYLRHPEPFIRLHAIRRVAELMLPDAVPALAKRLDDPLESEQNRDEAGWAIRRICKFKGVSWFAKTPWTDRYDGSETAADRYGVTLVAGDESGTAVTSGNTVFTEAVEDEVLLRIQMDEQDLGISFSVVPWFVRNARYLFAGAAKALLAALVGIGKGLLRLAVILGKGIWIGLKRLVSMIGRLKTREPTGRGVFRKKQESATEVPYMTPALAGIPNTIPVSSSGFDVSSPDTSPVESQPATFLIGAQEAGYPANGHPQISLLPPPRPTQQRTSPPTTHSSQYAIERLRYGKTDSVSRVRKHSKGGNAMFRLLFYPVRLVRNHWVFTLLVLVAFYALLGFSSPGRRFVYQLNPGAQLANDRVVSVMRVKAADFLGLSVTKTREKDGTADQAQTGPSAESVSLASTASDNTESSLTGTRSSQVTAPKGLNLRKTPDAAGEKIVWMKLGDPVTLMGISQTDAAGDLWQTVQYKDQTGWAMDKWLSPEAEGAAHDGS